MTCTAAIIQLKIREKEQWPLSLSPRVRGSADTWKLVGWAVKRDPSLLERVKEYLGHWAEHQ